MHDILFSDQKRFSQGDFLDDARLLKLNDQEFTRCLAGSASETVKNAASEAGKLGISSDLPGFFGPVAIGEQRRFGPPLNSRT
jgi:hypothetical protein